MPLKYNIADPQDITAAAAPTGSIHQVDGDTMTDFKPPTLDFQPEPQFDFQPETPFNPAHLFTNPPSMGQIALGAGATIGQGAVSGVKHIVDSINSIMKMGGEATDMHPLKGAAIAYHLLMNTPDEIDPNSPSGLDKFSKVLGDTQAQLAAEEKEQGVPPIPQIAGEVAGGFIPGLIEWGKKVPGTIYATLTGAAEAHAEGESWPTAVKMGAWGGVKRVLLQNVLDRYSEINNAYIRRGLGSVTLAAAEAAQGGTPTQIATQGVVGGFVTGRAPESGPKDTVTRGMVSEPGPMPEPKVYRPEPPTEVPGAEAARPPSGIDFQPDVSQIIADTANTTGGATIDLQTGEPIKSGFAAAVSKDYEEILPTDKVTKEQVDDYRQRHADVLAEDPHRTVGAWVDKGKMYLDVSHVVQDKAEALDMAKINKQLAIFDLGKFETIPTEQPPVELPKPLMDLWGIKPQLPPDLPEPQGPEAARIPVSEEFPTQETGPKQEIPPTTPPVVTPPATTPVSPPAAAQPTAMRRNTALQVAHDAAKVLGMTDEERGMLNEQLTGKASMADMTIDEARKVAMELQKQVSESGLRIPQVGPNAPNLPDVPATMTVGGATRPAKEILESATQIANGLHSARGSEPRVLSATNGVQTEGLVKRGIATMVGDNNLSIPALAKKIGGIFEGMIKSIMIDDYADGQRKYNSFVADLLKSIPEQAKTAGVTPDDLRQMSRTQDPRYGFIRAGFKLTGHDRTVEYPFTLGGKSVKMTGGEMLDLYLSLRQENGIDHVKTSGIKMFGRRFLNVTEDEVNKINDFVNTRPKLKAMADIMTKTATTVNNPKLNETFHDMEGDAQEDIADNDNYWHLTIDNPNTARGKEAVPMSFIDNPRVLKERTGGGKGALVVGDAFDKFAKVEEAVGAYVGLAHPIRNMRTLLNYGPFINALDAKGLSPTRDKIISLLDRAQNPRSTESTGAQFVQPFLSGAYRGVLQFNLRPIAAEFMGEIQELALPDFTLKDVSSLGAGIKNPALVKEMLDHSPTAYTRYHYGTSSFELAQIERNEHAMVMFSGQHSDINKPSIMMKTTDALKLSLGWKKAKEMVAIENKDLQPGSQEYWDAVDKRATSYWQETCPSWDRWNRSMNSSDPTIGRQVFFMFRSYWEKACSVLNTANTKYEYSDKTPDDKKEWAKAYGATMASIVANAAVRCLIGQYVWQQKRTLAQNVADIVTSPFHLMAISGSYLQRAASSFMQLAAGQKLAPSFAADSSLPLEMVNMAGKTVEDYAKAAGHWIGGDQDKAKEALQKAVLNSVMIGALARGVPVYDIQRTYRTLMEQQDAVEASRSK